MEAGSFVSMLSGQIDLPCSPWPMWRLRRVLEMESLLGCPTSIVLMGSIHLNAEICIILSQEWIHRLGLWTLQCLVRSFQRRSSSQSAAWVHVVYLVRRDYYLSRKTGLACPKLSVYGISGNSRKYQVRQWSNCFWCRKSLSDSSFFSLVLNSGCWSNSRLCRACG